MTTNGSRYRAPALEKGLDILELMARSEKKALTMSDISQALGRSKGEIFRMLQVLEERGYIGRRAGEDGYLLTNRLFRLGIERPPMRGLLEGALPEMHRLANAIGQSCHLAVAAGDEVVIVARVEAPGPMSFSVRLGHRGPIAGTCSGLVLRAWGTVRQPKRAPAEDRRLAVVRADGHATQPSPMVNGVTDLSAPVLEAGFAIAALTIPFVEYVGAPVDQAGAARRLIEAAQVISEAVRVGQNEPYVPSSREIVQG